MKDTTNNKILMIQPPYPHYSLRDNADSLLKNAPLGKWDDIGEKNPFLPLSLIWAGNLIERTGMDVKYLDLQLHHIYRFSYEGEGVYTLDGCRNFGITAMGAQNIAPARKIYDEISSRIPDAKIILGGQGVEGLTEKEFSNIFPRARKISRLSRTDINDGCIENNLCTVPVNQLEKFSEDDLKRYLTNELTLPVSQGCMYGCSFCGAQIKQKEQFFNTEEYLEGIMKKAKSLDINKLSFYCTSLDFFQQYLHGNPELLEKKLTNIIDLKEKYGIDLTLRALTRADSYNKAMSNPYVIELVKKAGFNRFGFGADGSADPALLKAMHKGNNDMKTEILRAFEHSENNGLVPEILYVFGILEDTSESLQKTYDFATGLMKLFPTSEYRGFPAKNQIPGNELWKGKDWINSPEYHRLVGKHCRPELFMNLGFETLANDISHPDESKRKLVNKYAIGMSYKAHKYGRVQSFLTLPVFEGSYSHLMDEESFEKFKEILSIYVPPNITVGLTMENIYEYSAELNKMIPKDK